MKLLKNDTKRLIHLCKYPFLLSLCAMIATNIIQFNYDAIWAQGATVALERSDLLHSFSQSNLYLFSAGVWLASAPIFIVSYDFYYSFFGKGAYFTHTIPQKSNTLLFSKFFTGVALLWITAYLVYFTKASSYFLINGFKQSQIAEDLDFFWSFLKILSLYLLLGTLQLFLLCTSISLGHWLKGGIMSCIFFFFALFGLCYTLILSPYLDQIYIFAPLCILLCFFLFFVNHYVISKKINVV